MSSGNKQRTMKTSLGQDMARTFSASQNDAVHDDGPNTKRRHARGGGGSSGRGGGGDTGGGAGLGVCRWKCCAQAPYTYSWHCCYSDWKCSVALQWLSDVFDAAAVLLVLPLSAVRLLLASLMMLHDASKVAENPSSLQCPPP